MHRYRESAASDEQQLRTPEDGRVAQLTTDVLVTRINSLLYIEENLPAMEKIVQDRSAADHFMMLPNHYFSRVDQHAHMCIVCYHMHTAHVGVSFNRCLPSQCDVWS